MDADEVAISAIDVGSRNVIANLPAPTVHAKICAAHQILPRAQAVENYLAIGGWSCLEVWFEGGVRPYSVYHVTRESGWIMVRRRSG